MAKVTGIGGVFFKAQDPDALASWYREHLGLAVGTAHWTVFPWREPVDPARPGSTVWSLFPFATHYFGSKPVSFMVNYRVDDLKELITELRAAGIEVDEHGTEDENGRFAWLSDTEGNCIELWEPAPGRYLSSDLERHPILGVLDAAFVICRGPGRDYARPRRSWCESTIRDRPFSDHRRLRGPQPTRDRSRRRLGWAAAPAAVPVPR